MRVEHPRAGDGPGAPPAAVDIYGTTVPVDDDGTFEVPPDAEGWLPTFAIAHDTTPEALRVDATETCEAVKSDGEVCGRDLPCQYHSNEEG